LLQYLRTDRPDLLEHIRTTKDLPSTEALDDAIRAVKKGFDTIDSAEVKPQDGAAPAEAAGSRGATTEGNATTEEPGPSAAGTPGPEAVDAGARAAGSS
jgi:hypothetical protein